ncbi:putative F-box associated interaction domain, F-box-like domain superfamily [Helianthus annuus]|nr:putative F-box associated interaction domain, F-box-like domain superfamily [Helianthus annuus]KAJ0617148.1 putative F-box associated interaction domain, F-box-like domain superfamily [Helianthus annuus]
MAQVSREIEEDILVRSEAEQLVRFTRLCKPWRSLITSPRFVGLHLENGYRQDCTNDQVGQRRVSLPSGSGFPIHQQLIGSSMGLVAVISVENQSEVLIVNPLTRVRRVVQLPDPMVTNFCMGFGYDSNNTDFKLLVGCFEGGNQDKPCLHVFSLKSDSWKLVSMKYRWFYNKFGLLSDGVVYWLSRLNVFTEKILISYDISKEIFQEIPLPEYTRSGGTKLGMIERSVCVYRDDRAWKLKRYTPTRLWDVLGAVREVGLVKNYLLKNYWETLHLLDRKKHDIIHILRVDPEYVDSKWCPLPLHVACNNYMDQPLFVRSLMSPVLQ